MDRDFMTKTIQVLTDLLTDHYVFPEMAAALRSELTERLHSNEYEGITEPSVVAELLTSHMQTIARDKHLNIRYHVASPQSAPDQEERDAQHNRFLTMMRLDNYGFTKIERLPGNIGYVDFRAFMPPELAGETASSAMTFLAGTSSLIIDLRHNYGGSPYMVAFLSSYLLEPEPTYLNGLYWRKHDETQQFWSQPYVPGKRFGGTKPLVLLTSRNTFSAAEEFAYNLQAIGRAKIIGERTGGGAHPGQMHRVNELFEAFIPSGRAVNPVTKTNWEGAGVAPDIEVPQAEALDTAHVMLLQQELQRLSDASSPGYERVIDEIKATLEDKAKQTVHA